VSQSGEKWVNLVFCGFTEIKKGRFSVFRGVHHINMDAKGRLAIPAKHREPLLGHCSGEVVITIDTQVACLALYPLPEWEVIQDQIQALPALKPAVKRFQRLTLGYATDLEMDANGRLLLPAPLREYANLDKKLVLVGQGNKLEIWSENLWLSERDKALLESGADTELPEELMSLTL
jgi:MraZ protein